MKRLIDGATHRGRVRDRVEQHEIMDCAIVADRPDRNASCSELAAIDLALIAQHVVLVDQEQRLGQALSCSELALTGET